jgi:hypothetical protein
MSPQGPGLYRPQTCAVERYTAAFMGIRIARAEAAIMTLFYSPV